MGSDAQLATYNLDIALVAQPVSALAIAAPAQVCAGAPFVVTVTAFGSLGKAVSGYVGVNVTFAR